MEPVAFCWHHASFTSVSHWYLVSNPSSPNCLLLHNSRMQALRALHVYRLHVTVQLLLRTLFVVSLSGNSYSKSVRDALDAALPDLLVQLWVKADVFCALCNTQRKQDRTKGNVTQVWISSGRTIAPSANFLISLMAFGARFLNAAPWI